MTMDASKNSAVPSGITSGSLTSTFSWNGALGITGSSGPNGATSAYNYDTQARPSQTTSPTGQVVKYEYTTAPSTQLSVADGRWTRTTYDGLGRQSMVETGYETGAFPSLVRTTVSVVDTMYTPCGCSPLGKVLKVSLPHAIGGTQYWTEYVYDALGRTIQVKQPSSSGTANYLYAGSTVKSTDAAGKWNQFENDTLGNLIKVTEPNPGGCTYDTNYTYSELNQLLTVSMPRGAVTQTRTFVYNATTQRLTSVTNPENGTTTNYYNADGTLDYKIDAKLQKISYDYDSLMRVTAVHRFPDGVNEDTMQRTNFEYDANSVVPSFSANVNGRLAVAKSYATTVTGGTTAITTFYEMYSYDAAGRVLKKRLRVSNNALGDVDKDVEYGFTGAKLDSVKYPDMNVLFTYYYDNMLRPNRMTGSDSQGTVVDYVNSVNYNVSSRMTSMWALNIGSSTYTYNVRNELTRQQTGSLADIEYEYSPGADNGQILSRTNNISAEKVSYQYDALKRLVSASSPNWGSTYKHDGWGNLTDKTPTAGSAPLLSVTVNGLTNRINSGGFTYDANGNMTSSGAFDVENRLTTAGGESYGYLTNNQRVYKRDASGAEWIYFHDASGKRIMTFQMANAGGTLVVSGTSKNVYFAGRSIILNDTAVVTDRLGSVVSRGGAAVDYFPYGEEKVVTANPAEKFGTYMRDATGLDYANQRYFASSTGRFLSSDPYQASGGAGSPASWNRYAYVGNDPTNFIDRRGLELEPPEPPSPDNPVEWCDATSRNERRSDCNQSGPSIPHGVIQDYEQLRINAENWQASMRKFGKDAIDNMKKDCKTAIRNEYDLTGLAQKGGTDRYYEAFFVGSRPLSDFGISGGGNVNSAFNGTGAVAITGQNRNGTPNDQIILGPLFVRPNGMDPAGLPSGSVENWQTSYLIHEILHTYTGLGDSDLAAKFKLGVFLTSPAGNAAASLVISNWLIGGCK